MNWYVKYEGTEEIAGPMSKDEALAMADRVDGMIFSGNIFSPQFVTTSEAEAVLTGLRRIQQLVGPGLLTISAELLQQAIDTITLLSAEIFSGDIFPPSEQAPSSSKEVEDLLCDLEGMAAPGAPDCIAEPAKKAIDMITSLSRKKSGNIFSPKIVTVPEVQEVIEALHVLCGWTQEDRDFNELLEEVRVVSRRAMDTLNLLLSRLLSVKPQAPTSKEVEGLLHELQGIRESLEIIRQGEDDAVGLVLKQAIDTITLLSVEQEPAHVVTSEVEAVLTDLQYHCSIAPSVTMQKAIDVITSLSREKVIECSIRGGVFDVESEIPLGVTLKVRDYDIEGHDSDRLSEDENGNSCVESEYASRG